MRLYCAGSLVAPASSSPLGRWRDAAEDGCGGGVEALCNCATRKGLISYELGAGGPVLQPVAFLADPVTAVLPHAGGVMAALRMGHFGAKLHASKDGQTWEEITAPAYPPEPEPPDTDQMGRPWPWRLDMIWTLESDGRGGFWAGTIPGGLFHSPDGVSWTLDRGLWDDPRRKQWFGGGYDTPGVHSVLVHPRDPDDVVIGVSCGGIWRTRDGGKACAGGPGAVRGLHAAAAALQPRESGPASPRALSRRARGHLVSAPQRRVPIERRRRHVRGRRAA